MFVARTCFHDEFVMYNADNISKYTVILGEKYVRMQKIVTLFCYDNN